MDATKPTAPTWRETIRRYRDERGMTQRELASRLGITTNAVAFWEQGITTPSTSNQRRLVSVLGISSDDLHAIYAAEDVA